MGAGPKIKCLTCNKVIQSMHRHDYTTCLCRENQEMINEAFIAEYNDLLGPITDAMKDELRLKLDEKSTAISADGGSDYLKMSIGPKAVWEMWNDSES